MRRESSALIAALVMGFGWAASPAGWARETPPKTERPLIVRSHIIAPRTVGAFRLVKTTYRPEQKAAGASFRYTSVPEPGLSGDVFVYPAGRQPQAEAIERGMQDFHASLRAAQEANYFRNLKLLGEENFPLEVTDGASASADPVVAALASTALIGRRIDMTLDIGEAGVPYRSRGYLFYKQLNFYKARISVPVDAMDAQAFSVFADHAARSLVSAIDTLNIGGCADKTVHVDSNAKDEDTLLAMVKQIAVLGAENCKAEISLSDLAERTQASEIITIDYAAGEWSSR